MPGRMESNPPSAFPAEERRMGSFEAFVIRKKLMRRGTAARRTNVAVIPKVSIAKPRGATETMAPRLESPRLMAA